ncbi:hypothetical protein [Petropleomorpha daqingensis]|uniref:DUF3558 domain-containing protein n=1 Tax=Petropleomorpha daqingensis TaxID=2026353 RepID=A0A853CGJ6_9ACTN|nr:hypothetical protein [Petropleomorpha daqingensis]NYJ05428.1 hypothetical protein [Petropleomorpha daqingensis]
MRIVGPGARVVVAVLLALLVTGCSDAARSAAPTTPATTSATATTVDPSVAAEQYASPTPPSSATMICSDEIRSQVTGALDLDSTPTPQSAWADHVYTCTYAVPMGTLVLAVTVAPSVDAAGAELDALRTQVGATAPEQGFGARAYSAPGGVLVAVKDNLVLTVDATALPDDLGAGHQRRIDVVRLLAAGVFACWTGES